MRGSVEYNGQKIEIRDAYLNATALCQANDKLVADYLRQKEVQEFLAELASDMGIPISRLVIFRKGGRGPRSEQGTWVHELVWYNLGQWCSRKCAVWVVKLLHKLDVLGDFTRAAHNEPVPVGDQVDLDFVDASDIAVVDTPTREEQRPADPLASLDDEMLGLMARDEDKPRADEPPIKKLREDDPDLTFGDRNELERREAQNAMGGAYGRYSWEQSEGESPSWHTDNPEPRARLLDRPKTPAPCGACQPILPGTEEACGVRMVTTSEGYICRECLTCFPAPFAVCPHCGTRSDR